MSWSWFLQSQPGRVEADRWQPLSISSCARLTFSLSFIHSTHILPLVLSLILSHTPLTHLSHTHTLSAFPPYWVPESFCCWCALVCVCPLPLPTTHCPLLNKQTFLSESKSLSLPVKMRALVPGISSRPEVTSLEAETQARKVIHPLDAYRIHLDMTGGGEREEDKEGQGERKYPGSW